MTKPTQTILSETQNPLERVVLAHSVRKPQTGTWKIRVIAGTHTWSVAYIGRLAPDLSGPPDCSGGAPAGEELRLRTEGTP